MPRRRRYIESDRVYAVTFRCKRGLPFVATKYMNSLLAGIEARSQRDDKVIVCHRLWMSNHPHLIVVAKDAENFTAFYQEVKKKITEAIKALLGYDSMSLWEGRAIVAKVLDYDAVVDQIAYLYANPSRAHLVNSIGEYPLLNSYNDFIAAGNNLNAIIEKKGYWTPASEIPMLSQRLIKGNRDSELTALLQERGTLLSYKIQPNAWMKCFGITEESEIAEQNEKILESIREREAKYAALRAKAHRAVLGARALALQPIMKPHKPPRGERRIFVISSLKELRIEFIKEFDALCEYCAECFERARRGILCKWPPGIFRPGLLHVASAWEP